MIDALPGVDLPILRGALSEMHSRLLNARVLRTSTGPAELRPEDYSAITNQTGDIPRGKVTLEVLFDPAGHARLPIADDEIVARALTVQGKASRAARFVTYDTAQSFRARQADLLVIKLDQPVSPEPPPAKQRKQRHQPHEEKPTGD